MSQVEETFLITRNNIYNTYGTRSWISSNFRNSSKKQITKLHNIETGILEMLSPKQAGYRFGLETGRDIVLLQSAALETPLDKAAFSDVDDGARSELPLRASDLPWLSGPALGVALKQAEADWIASGLSLSKDALIAKSLK